MNKKLFWIFFGIIILASFLLRIIPPKNNNFFFTIDQGNDAVFVRELTERGQLLFKGPETGIVGIFAGPGWYYFTGAGYKLFNGHPYGALFATILLNIGTVGFLMWKLSKKVSPQVALLTGAVLQTSWYFYDTSRWAFNPFPLIFLSFWEVFLLIGFLEGKKKNFAFALIPIALGFNAEVAGFGALLVFHFFVGLYSVYKKRAGWRYLLGLDVLLPGILFLPYAQKVITEYKLSLIPGANERGIFTGTNFIEMAKRFEEIFSRSIFPQSFLISILIFAVVFYLFVKKPSLKNIFIKRFVSLTFLLFAVCYLLFSTNKGWREWHTLFLYPLIFVSVLLMLFSINKKIGAFLFLVITISQILVFVPRYNQYLSISSDPSVLANQILVLDWIYSKNESDGFNVYIYTPNVYDYNWQYDFWWYGRNRYGFIPCEYTIEPGFLKDTYLKNSNYYSKPVLGCDKFRFLIIEPVGDQKKFDKWYEKAIARTKLVEEMTIGGVIIEKRIKN